MQGSMAPSGGVNFRGSYHHQLDEKGRVSLPAQYRRDAAEQRFVLAQPYPPSLSLFPEAEWGLVEERLGELQARHPNGRMYVASVMASAVEVTPDAQGRILIPQRLKEAASLGGVVMLVGMINKIDVWDPVKFEEALAAADQADDFGQFRAQIFR
jgi:MraZ protein